MEHVTEGISRGMQKVCKIFLRDTIYLLPNCSGLLKLLKLIEVAFV